MWDRLITLLIALLTSGLIQFFFTRKDNKDTKIKELEAQIKSVNDERERVGKERFEINSKENDENSKAIEELRQAVLKMCKTQESQSQVAEAHSELLIGLAQDRLVHSTNKYIKRGMITLDELAVIEDIYAPYHDKLGGNGRGKAGVEKCRALPVVAEEIVMLKEKEERLS